MNFCTNVSILLMTFVSTVAFAEAPTSEEQRSYKSVDNRSLELTIIRSNGFDGEAKRPAIVFFHGGGWVGGKPGQFEDLAKHLASRSMVCVLAQYRLLDKKNSDPPIICTRDAKSAIRWVRSHAEELGIDPNRIAAGGGSAGGHLAAFVGLVDSGDEPTEDVSVSSKANALALFKPFLDNGSDGGWGKKRVGDRIEEFSPAHNITPDDPPAIVFMGTEDKLIPVSTIERFKNNMTKAGIRCDAFFYEDQGHGFFNREPYKSKTIEETDRFFESLGWLPQS